MRSSAIVDRVAALLERRRVLRDILVEYFEPNGVILEQGRTEHQFLYVVESGFVRLPDRETQRLVNECAEGNVFGSHGLILGGAGVDLRGQSRRAYGVRASPGPARLELPIAVRGC
jgi:CRP-like cAMP-binding protein